jgi:Rrf2 family iron-sulfur cluster assembly transcriptional regulator
MRVTTKGRYALRAITNLALTGSDRPVPIKQIAADEEISPEFLEQIFFRLKKSGIISSVRGPGGGFLLERDPSEISVREIFEAVGEGLEITPCTSEEDCDRADDCLVHDVWQEASEHIVSYFDKLTLRRIMDMNQDKMLDSLVTGKEFSV